MKLIDLPEARDLALQLTTIKASLGQLGLFKSMHALDECTGKLGFEIEEHLLHHAAEERRKADSATPPHDTRNICRLDSCHRREPCGAISCGYE